MMCLIISFFTGALLIDHACSAVGSPTDMYVAQR